MNTRIVYPLILLVILGAFSQLVYLESVNLSSNSTISEELVQNQTLTGTESELEVYGGSFTIDFEMTIGLIVIIVSALFLGLIGIKVLGSGLSEHSVKIIWNGLIYYGLWGVFSAFAINAFFAIPIFGAFFWFVLTFIYTLGLLSKMGGKE